ncbi:mevalonate kinase [Weizmannia acidilactici]|uniref:mevalonate kinase n=1 Tax=Weizmannia acidilactici TaxID=2607726 RepID=A0A5J4JNS9_9BACI|nr:mevalonate kinase [Weizmannia acidilactici]GER66654.1 mevalonate kinase [Weizmannia acidilactici]GER70654.1 mevalonate kinase [Weizmannia acidilactici]GER72814.1 mevalonate kinase [Weizmannia acidilactici]
MIKIPGKTATGTAHGKLILAGEHSVVYGKPAIALPFHLVQVEANVIRKSGPLSIDCLYYTGAMDEAPPKMMGITACAKETLKTLNEPAENLVIKLESTVPIGRGLGSSAAVAVAVVRGLYAFFGRKLSEAELERLVQIAENFAHGNPSGIDMMTVINDHPIWFEKGKPVRPMPVSLRFYLVVADSGRIHDTSLAVKSIREKRQYEPEMVNKAIGRLGKIVYEVKEALDAKDGFRLGQLLNEAQAQLSALGVSDAGLDDLTGAARAAGALGAKLTGAGRGGCIIALAETREKAETVAAALQRAGAIKTWYFSLEGR